MDTKLLKQKILDLAIRGKLVPQDPNDEPASVLLERIRAEREKLIAEGKLKRTKNTSNNRHYENVPFEVPESWEWVKLSEIASFGGGKTPSMAKKAYWQNGSNLWVTSKDMKSDRIDDSKMKISDEALSIMTVYEPGTLLLVTRSGILRHSMPLAILDKKASVNQDIKTISLFVTELNEFVFYSIKARESFILKNYHKDGTTVDSIDFDKFSNILLPIPPLYEQIRIVKTIGRLFSSIDELQKNRTDIQDIAKQTKSKILDLAIHGKLVEQDPNDEPASELLKRIAPNATPCDISHYPNIPESWCVCSLGDIVKVINGKNQSKVVNSNGAYPIYGSGGIMGYADDYLCPENCTIIGRKGTINNPILVKTKFWNVDTAFGMAPSEAINYRYFFYFCSSFDFTELDKSTTLPSLTKSNIEKIEVPLPPMAEQDKIVKMIEKSFSLLDAITMKL